MPYTYYLFHKPTKQHYYGARWANNCSPDDLWTAYFTSSKHVKALITQYGVDSFDVQVRKTFNTKEEARDWEYRVLTRLNAKKNPLWINRTNSKMPDCTGLDRSGQGKGKKLSDYHKSRISIGNKGKLKGRKQNTEHVIKAAQSRIGLRRTDDTKIKMSRSSRNSKTMYTFTNYDIVFYGGMADWSETFNTNVKSAASMFCIQKQYKGWSRI